MRISQLSSRSGVPVSTLRYYESEGLLPADRAMNGYRIYAEEAVDRLAFINQAKSLSLPLVEIRQLVQARDAEPCRSVRARYRPMLNRHSAQLERRVGQLQALQATIAEAVRHLDDLPDRETACDANCSFLQESPGEGDAQVELPVSGVQTPETIACSLGGGDYAERVADWRALVANSPRTEIDAGLRFRLPIAKLQAASALAVAEQRCCNFYRIGFQLHGDQFDLTLTAPPEAAAMLADVFGTDTP